MITISTFSHTELLRAKDSLWPLRLIFPRWPGSPATSGLVGTAEGIGSKSDIGTIRLGRQATAKVVLRTARNHLGGPELAGGAARLPVQPGRLVTVDLHTGERSVLSYLTDRILHTTTTAFRER